MSVVAICKNMMFNEAVKHNMILVLFSALLILLVLF